MVEEVCVGVWMMGVGCAFASQKRLLRRSFLTPRNDWFVAGSWKMGDWEKGDLETLRGGVMVIRTPRNDAFLIRRPFRSVSLRGMKRSVMTWQSVRHSGHSVKIPFGKLTFS